LAIHPDGPAEKAGIRTQDLITAMTGTRIRQMTDLSDILETLASGQTISVDIIRDGKKHTVKLVLGRRPASAKTPSQTTSPATREPVGNTGTAQNPSVTVPTPPAELLPEPPEQLSGPMLIEPRSPSTASKATPPAPTLPETLEQPVSPTLELPKTVEPQKDASQRIDQLQRRIEALERRIAELEKALAESKGRR
jgi:membrane-associated protease RseP (regulator of RpoE activity)